MSPLWRDEIGVHLAQRRACLVRLRRGLHPAVVAEEGLSDPDAGPGWDAPLTMTDQEFRDRQWSDARLRVVVADLWVRYAVVPWSDVLSSEADQNAHARALMEGVFGGDMSDWMVSVADAPPGAARLASAISMELMQSIRDLAAAHRLRLASVQPQLIVAYNNWLHRLPQSECAWFVTVDHGSLAALRLGKSGVDRVHAVRIGPDWELELKRLQTFGRLSRTSVADGRVYADLPDALRAVHAEAFADLEWLDERNPPLNTLQQLAHLRRRTA